jgi:hypothetical protein
MSFERTNEIDRRVLEEAAPPNKEEDDAGAPFTTIASSSILVYTLEVEIAAAAAAAAEEEEEDDECNRVVICVFGETRTNEDGSVVKDVTSIHDNWSQIRQ